MAGGCLCPYRLAVRPDNPVAIKPSGIDVDDVVRGSIVPLKPIEASRTARPYTLNPVLELSSAKKLATHRPRAQKSKRT